MRHAVGSLRNHVVAVVLALGVAGGALGRSPEPEGSEERIRPDDAVESVGHCHEISVPVDLTLQVDEEQIAAGSPATIEAVVEAHEALTAVQLALTPEGPVELTGATLIELGAMARGDVQVVRIPVRYPTAGRSVVRVALAAMSAVRDVTYDRHEGLYVILEAGHATAGPEGFERLDLRRIEDDYRAELIDEEEARARARLVTAPPVTIDQEPRSYVPLTDEQEALARGIEPFADPDDTYVPDDGPGVDLRRTSRRVPNFVRSDRGGKRSPAADLGTTAGGTITVQGVVSWLDQNGGTRAAFGVTVQVRDDELIGSEVVTEGTTDANGQYSFTVDNDDGFLAGDRDIFVRFRTANSTVSLESAGILGTVYENDTAVMDEVPDGTVITENLTYQNTGTGPAGGLVTGATYVAAYATQLNSGNPLAQIVLEWPGSTASSNYDGSDINLQPGERWDWDVMFHEYGHYVMDTFNFEQNPGGAHAIGDCIAVTQSSKLKGIQMAWAEGWPTFFGTAAQQQLNLAALGVPRVGDVVYADTDESTLSYSLETQDSNGLGEDNELATQRVFWDLFDAAADGRDAVQVTDQSLFDLVTANGPTTLSAAWGVLRPGLSNVDDLAYGAVTTDHRIGPRTTAPAANSIVTPPQATFSWAANVGCDSSFAGDSFDLVFYHPTSSAKLLTLPGIGTTSRTLTMAEFQTLVSASHALRWAVEGRNSASPATGAYLGESRVVTLDRPPVCDPGGPYQLECAVSATLDGSGSSDPDGDPLTFAWSGAFTGGSASGPMPAVVYPATGNSAVTLAVADGFVTSTCSAAASVLDTLAPVLPPDVVAECASPAGTEVSLGSPSDLCDPSVTSSNDAPASFPLGSTPVAWTATDASGNTTTGTQQVTVVDTTPPTLDVVASPDILWPPDHTLRNVHFDVTASDACDDAPTIRLESVTSSELDEKTGPRDRRGDIQHVTPGSDDRFIRLRAEHGAGGHRTYTVTFSATDGSGNSTIRQVLVRVPKSLAELVSRDGRPADGPSTAVALSANGRFVAFVSDAVNLVGGDTNDVRDVFLRDRLTGLTERVSVGEASQQANRASHARNGAPAISGDGAIVAFYSRATNLVANDSNGVDDIFVRDRNAGQTERISVGIGSADANGSSSRPSVSEDGRFLAFQSLASNLAVGDTNRASDIFVYDRLTDTTDRICDGVEANGPSTSPSISADGTAVAFASAATNLVANDTNRRIDIFVCERASGAIERISVAMNGAQGDRDSMLPAISKDGLVVAFKSYATNLVPGDLNDLVDVFARDRTAASTERVSVGWRGGDADDLSFPPSVSHDGRFVAFGSAATNLAPFDSNGTSNVFVRDRQRQATLVVDVNDEGEQNRRGTLDVAPSVSGDGVQIGFVSLADSLAPRDADGADVFVVCNPFLDTPPAVPPQPLRRVVARQAAR